MKTSKRVMMGVAAGLAGTLGGCASMVDRSASMGLMSGPAPLTLGAGDTLGAEIYINDRVLAMRETGEVNLAALSAIAE